MTTFKLDQPSYTAYSGDSITLICSASITGGTIGKNDIIWQFYPIASNNTVTVIYFNGGMQNNPNGKYQVNTVPLTTTSVTSTLTVSSLNTTDATYVYQCVCNIYSACASGNKASASATFNILTTTTSTTTTTTTTTTSTSLLWLSNEKSLIFSLLIFF